MAPRLKGNAQDVRLQKGKAPAQQQKACPHQFLKITFFDFKSKKNLPEQKKLPEQKVALNRKVKAGMEI